MSNIPTQRSIDLNTGYCLYYVLLFSTLVLLAYLSISVLISSIVYWLVHYILKASNSKILFIYGLSYGDSMSPALPDGLKLILLVYPFNLTKGDVVVYNTTGRFIKHRIIDVEETSSSTLYYVKGDNDQAVEWEILQVLQRAKPWNEEFEFELLTNEKKDEFMNKLMQKNYKSIKTFAEINRLAQSFKVSERLKLEEIEILDKEAFNSYSYDFNYFIEDEIRLNSQQEIMVLKFSASVSLGYLKYDMLSFIVSEIQLSFPEYLCKGVFK